MTLWRKMLLLLLLAISILSCNPFGAFDNRYDPERIIEESWEITAVSGNEFTFTIDHQKAHGDKNFTKANDSISYTGGGGGGSTYPIDEYTSLISMYTAYHFVSMPDTLLKLPPVLYDTWTEDIRNGYSAAVSVESLSDTISTGNITGLLSDSSTYTDCITTKTIISGNGFDEDEDRFATDEENQYIRGIRYIWYAKDIGIVKVEYFHEDGTVTIVELVSFSGNPSTDYFPMALGDKWTYYWTMFNDN